TSSVAIPFTLPPSRLTSTAFESTARLGHPLLEPGLPRNGFFLFTGHLVRRRIDEPVVLPVQRPAARVVGHRAHEAVARTDADRFQARGAQTKVDHALDRLR